MSNQEEIIDRLKQLQHDSQNLLSRLWSEYAQCNDKLQVMRGREQGYMDTINRLRDEKDAHEETIQDCYDNVAGSENQIEQLKQNINDMKLQILAQRRHYEEIRFQREAYEQTVSSLYQTIQGLRAVNQHLVEENHHGQNVQSDYLASICRLSADLASSQAALRVAEGITAQGVEYLYDDEHNNNRSDDEVDPVDVHPTLRGDLDRAPDCLGSAVITTVATGPVMWVSVEWDPSTDGTDDNTVPICLRIELNAALYMAAPTPPKLKFTRDGEEFPLGHRLSHMLKQYLQRHWSVQGGFRPPSPPGDLIPSEFEYDTDPRCVVPYVAEESGLIAHLVRYAMLRMETYADFCVVCDRPIQYNRGVVVICGSDLCDYSFHEVGVGYGAVGLERTAGTAPSLHRSALSCGQPGENMGEELLTSLLVTAILRYMPTARHHSLVCSAGSLGYHSLKEMLLSGVPGNTLLVESGDLREVVGTIYDMSNGTGSPCCLVYTFNCGRDLRQPLPYKDHIPPTVTQIHAYWDTPMSPTHLLDSVSCLKKINLHPPSPMTSIWGLFLSGCTGLTTIDLSPLSGLKEIQWSFLNGCSGLTSIDLSPLSQVTCAGWSCLTGCSGLTTIDLSPLSKLKELRDFFLARCTGLETINLGKHNLFTEIGGCFLLGCTSLTTIDLTPLSAVEYIKTSFLAGCCGLKSIDLSPLSQVTSISAGFLKGCTGLSVIDMSPLTNLTELPDDLVTNCGPNTRLILPTHLDT